VSTRAAVAPAVVALLGCSSAATPDPNAGGLQYTFDADLDPSQEVQRCRFFVLPAEELWVQRARISLSPAVHHVSLYITDYAAIPTADVNGTPVDTSGPFDCPEGAGTWSWVRQVAVSQTPGDSDVVQLPAGVAFHFAPATVLLLNVHALNATPAPRHVAVALTLFPASTPASAEAGCFNDSDRFIFVPPHGSSSAHMRCPVAADTVLLDLQSHMHQHGVRFTASLVGPDGTAQSIYDTTEWDHPPVQRFPGGLNMHAGSQLEYRCDYANPTDQPVTLGQNASAEMCLLLGTYYPLSPAFDRCSLTADGTRGDGAVWIGGGTATCGEALACLLANPLPSDASGPGGNAYVACMQSTCPAVAGALSAVVQCQMNAGSACLPCGADPSAPTCQCIRDHCGDALRACQAATCP
jgi:hypothetical protein